MLLELRQPLFDLSGRRRLINLPQIARHPFAFFPVHIRQTVPHHMRDSELHFRFRITVTIASGKPVKPIHARNQNVLYAPIADLRQDLQP